jgi:protein TonB
VVGNKLQSKPLLRVVTDDTLRAEPLLIEAATDRHPWWRRAAAILAALLLHLAAITALIDKLPSEAPSQPAPIPVELAYEPPKPPQPPPPAEQKPPAQQQPLPERRSGGDLQHVPPGTAPAVTEAEKQPPTSAPVPPTTTPVPQTPPPAATPALPDEPSKQSLPVPPPTSARDTQQAMIAPPVPPKKPPAPAARQVTVAAPEQPPAATTTSPDADLQPGPGGGDRYLNAIRDDIRSHRVYPPTAELFRLTGTATYEIAINRQGKLLDARVSETSGFDILDKAGLQTIRLSAPFAPVPDDIPGDTIWLTLRLSIGP